MLNNTHKYVVMTVDDDPVILNAIIETLSPNYLLRPFTSSKDALNYLKTNTADLILLDHQMPNMTGLELLQNLQDNPKTRPIPVIFLTSSENSEDEIRALEIGAMDYLLKPFNPNALITRVRLQLELKEYRQNLESLVLQRTDELHKVNQKLKQRDKITMDLLAIASDLRDHETGTHLECVVLLSQVIVKDLLAHSHKSYIITEQYGNDIIDAVKLHDLGKIGIPDSVLLKQGKLTKDELQIMQTHPILGAEMIMQAIKKLGEDSMLRTAYEIIYGHHEKWDGTGYPLGAQGEAIPLSARITAIVDVFDALTSPRPYKDAWTADDAFAYISKDAGRHFDPYLTEVVRRQEQMFRQILNSKEAIATRTIFDFVRENAEHTLTAPCTKLCV